MIAPARGAELLHMRTSDIGTNSPYCRRRCSVRLWAETRRPIGLVQQFPRLTKQETHVPLPWRANCHDPCPNLASWPAQMVQWVTPTPGRFTMTRNCEVGGTPALQSRYLSGL
jgi:hypothetical protein